MSMNEMTVGEIGRSLTRLEESQRRQTDLLDEIKEQTTKTNGSVIRHEEWLKRHDTEFRDLKRGRAIKHGLDRQADRFDATTFTVPNNILKALGIIIGTGIVAAIAAWFGLKGPTP